jgi:malonate transporter and related proteins
VGHWWQAADNRGGKSIGRRSTSGVTTKLSVVIAALPSGFFGILFGTSYRRISDEANSTIIPSTIFSAATLAGAIAWTYGYAGDATSIRP